MNVRGDRIGKCLEALGRSQIWLAEQVGLKQPTISAYLKGTVKRPRMIKEIANALGTSQDYLLGETDDPAPPVQEKIHPDIMKAFEQMPGAPLTELEVRLIVGQLDLIALSRKPRDGGNQNNGQPQGG